MTKKAEGKKQTFCRAPHTIPLTFTVSASSIVHRKARLVSELGAVYLILTYTTVYPAGGLVCSKGTANLH